jgi:thiol:disulfide interchange protein DsbC
MNKLSAIDFKDLPLKDAFVIKRGTGARKIAIFEDPNCGYCKRFEADMQKINHATVYLFLYPILGADSTEKSKTIWCSTDKAKAWQDWMLNEVPLRGTSKCNTDALARNVEFGKKHRITGTPTILLADGTRIPGAISSSQLEKMLADVKSN